MPGRPVKQGFPLVPQENVFSVWGATSRTWAFPLSRFPFFSILKNKTNLKKGNYFRRVSPICGSNLHKKRKHPASPFSTTNTTTIQIKEKPPQPKKTSHNPVFDSTLFSERHFLGKLIPNPEFFAHSGVECPTITGFAIMT